MVVEAKAVEVVVILCDHSYLFGSGLRLSSGTSDVCCCGIVRGKVVMTGEK